MPAPPDPERPAASPPAAATLDALGAPHAAANLVDHADAEDDENGADDPDGDLDLPDAPAERDGGDGGPPAPVGKRERQRLRKRRRRMHLRPAAPVELTIDGFAHGGRALGRLPDGRIAFVAYALPGERVIAEVDEEFPRYVEATAVRVLEPSPARVTPRCPYFGPVARCGGCQLQHIDYGEQLRLKTAVVREQLERIGGFADAPVREMIGMSHPWGYRNHMRFTVRRSGDVGFMQHGTHRFLRIEHCDIAHPEVNRVLREAQGGTMQTSQLTVRVGANTGEILVQPRLRWRPHKRGRVESGQRTYRETLLGHRFRVSSPAFFQVNTPQAETLVRHAVARATAVRPHTVVDAYAGVGTFAAILAQTVPEVVTIEYSAAAGDDAERNLRDLPNVRRVVGTVEEQLPQITPAPDVVIVDPPRAGLERSVVETLIATPLRRIVYVSCEPATLARDLRLLVDGGYVLTEVQPVDMFPHTQHIECVTTLDRAPASPPPASPPAAPSTAPGTAPRSEKS